MQYSTHRYRYTYISYILIVLNAISHTYYSGHFCISNFMFEAWTENYLMTYSVILLPPIQVIYSTSLLTYYPRCIYKKKLISQFRKFYRLICALHESYNTIKPCIPRTPWSSLSCINSIVLVFLPMYISNYKTSSSTWNPGSLPVVKLICRSTVSGSHRTTSCCST